MTAFAVHALHTGHERSEMYRVYVVPTPSHPETERWFDAHTIRESPAGDLLEFMNSDGRMVGQLERSLVRGYSIAEDRRQYRRPVRSPWPEKYRVDWEPGSWMPPETDDWRASPIERYFRARQLRDPENR